jgi:hypothetical protein
MLLRIGHVQPLAGKKEKLDHANVGRQATLMQRVGISKIGIAAEQAVDHRRDEAVLEQVLRFFHPAPSNSNTRLTPVRSHRISS